MTLQTRQTDVEILDEIAHVLEGTEWDADTAEIIADLVRASGRDVQDIDATPADEDEERARMIGGAR